MTRVIPTTPAFNFRAIIPFAILLLSGVSATGLAAHDPAPPSGEARDFVANRHAGLTLTAKLVPAAVLAASENDALDTDADNDRARAAAFAYAADHSRNEDRGATVGQLAYLVLRLERGGLPVSGARFELSFEHIEDDKEVFATNSGETDGAWVWGQQFFDGAEHRAHISATAPNGESLATEMTVAVEGISPPAGSIVRSMLILLFVVAAGMVAGYRFGVRAGGGRNL